MCGYFFFFKHKTANEIRIRDCSSDVCSSDLAEAGYKRAEVDLDKSGFGGAASALSFMLNGLLDFGPDDGLQGFVGGGVGVSRGQLANDLVNDSHTGNRTRVV